MKFYSQSGEDQYLYDKYFRGFRNGVFLEMGALDGLLYSNTKFFEESLDWTGILIEPNPVQYKALRQNRPNCKNYNVLISDSTEELDFKYFHTGHAAVSGVADTLPDSHQEKYFDKFTNLPQSIIKIKPVTLTSIIMESGFKYIDLFSLDVEGHEYNVLKSFNFSVPIKMIIMENLGGEEMHPAELLLIQKGYLRTEPCAHNSVYIHKNYLRWAYS